MRHETIRRIDLWAGSLLVAALTAWRRVTDAVRPPPGPPRRILFLKLIEQGATVLAWDAVQRAVAKVGRDNVYFAVFAENRGIVDLMDLVPPDNVLVLRHDSLVRFCADALAVARRCRQLGIDTTVDMEFFARASAILGYMTGARNRVGLHRFTAEGPYRGDLMTHRVQYNPYLHTALNYSLLVAALDADPADLPLLKIPSEALEHPPARFEPTETERDEVRGIVEGLAGGPLPGPLVLLNPNAGDLLPLRRWHPDRFVALGRALLERHPDLTLGITGAPSERADAEAVAARIGAPPRVITLAGHTTLRQVVVLYTLADALVTNDSGPGHFASLTDIHNIVLFGPETPALFGPRGPRTHVIWARTACSPCVNVLNHRFSPCTDNVCMQRIEVDEVLRTVERCLEET